MKPPTEAIKRILPIAFAITMGLVAVGLTRQYLQQEQRKLQREWQRLSENYKNPIEVVVASKDLAEGTTLEATQLKMASVPDRFVQPYATRSPQDLIGKVTIAPIAEGEQILLNKLRRPEQVSVGSTLSALTPKGKRAVTIGVDTMSGVGGFVRPGDTVDLLWTFKLPGGGGQEGQVVTMALFQDVPVLAVGREMLGQARQTAETSNEYPVTLALTPQETSFLLFAREQGRIQLSLRSRLGGEGALALTPANINSLLESQLGLKAAPPLLPPVKKAEIYKGLKRDVVVLSDHDELSSPSP